MDMHTKDTLLYFERKSFDRTSITTNKGNVLQVINNNSMEQNIL